MMMLRAASLVCMLVLLLHTSQARAQQGSVQKRLQDLLKTKNIPKEIVDVVTALQSSMKLLRCLPTRKVGRCFTPTTYCDVDVKKFTLEAKMTICKSPWLIRLDFKIPSELKKKVPGIARKLVYIKAKPIIIRMNHSKVNGITSVVSNSRVATAGLKFLGLRFRMAKVYFNFYLLVRWDCTRPTNNARLRRYYNMLYSDGKPGSDMNKLYYILKVGYQVKVKKFWCFCYKCKKCETVLYKKGHFGEGPRSCLAGSG